MIDLGLVGIERLAQLQEKTLAAAGVDLRALTALTAPSRA
jgi:hypothetical protein